jgi:DNA-binding transcriptional ArsR family regulator
MGHQELAMIDEAASVGTSPWPLSVLFGGLVDPSRLSCLLTLRERPRTVREILAATDLSQPNLSKHLSRLPESSLVRAERSERFVAYGVADPEVEELLGVGEALLARIGGRPDREGEAR